MSQRTPTVMHSHFQVDQGGAAGIAFTRAALGGDSQSKVADLGTSSNTKIFLLVRNSKWCGFSPFQEEDLGAQWSSEGLADFIAKS